jgi:hypothetical protein
LRTPSISRKMIRGARLLTSEYFGRFAIRLIHPSHPGAWQIRLRSPTHWALPREASANRRKEDDVLDCEPEKSPSAIW